jgi:hypothetical protein
VKVVVHPENPGLLLLFAVGVRETVVLPVCWEQIIVLGIVAILQMWALHLAVVWQV